MTACRTIARRKKKKAALPYSAVCGERIADVAVVKHCQY